MRIVKDDALAIVTIAQEAIGEPLQGKIAVAEVIRNRMVAKFQSDGTVPGTVLRPFAFSGMNTGATGRARWFSIDDDDPHVKDCVIAWNVAKAGSNTVQGADSYVNLSIAKPNWAREDAKVAEVGRHTFYRLRGSS